MLKMKKKSSIGKKINKYTLYFTKIGIKYGCLKKIYIASLATASS